MLGRIVDELAQPGVAEATLIETGELALLARLEAAADILAMAPGELAAFIARRWLAAADEKDWLGLVAAMGRSDLPGLEALVTMLQQALAELDRKQADTGAAVSPVVHDQQINGSLIGR